MKKQFIIKRDEYGDIYKYKLNDDLYIRREVANNFTRTSSKYYLYHNGEIIMESGYGTGYSLGDLKKKALEIYEEMQKELGEFLDELYDEEYKDYPCDLFGQCRITCERYSECWGNGGRGTWTNETM